MEKVVRLASLMREDRERFILDNQEAFRYGSMVEFGLRNDHMEEDGEIISRSTIEECLDNPDSHAYKIVKGEDVVGGMILNIDEEALEGELEILFVSPSQHSRGIGKAAWAAVEAMYPEIKLWTTYTPYFETRNIHFYVNCLGFHIVEFYHKGHKDPHDTSDSDEDEMMFRFQKHML